MRLLMEAKNEALALIASGYMSLAGPHWVVRGEC
jgi:hypothetical protein